MKAGIFIVLGVSLALPVCGQLTGMPYSAIQTTQRVQTLADGTHITQPEQKTVVYRDSQGRTRTEITPLLPTGPGGVAAQPIPAMINIMDPVAGFHYFLDSRTKIAHRNAINLRRPPAGVITATPGPNSAVMVPSAGLTALLSPTPLPPPMPRSANRNQTNTESLGTQMIEGLLCNGNRSTMTIPAGAMGNDRDIITTTEMWTSQDLKIMVLSKRSDPRTGEFTTKLSDITRAEPDPALFMVPPDYTIQDQPQQGAPKQ